MRSCSVALLCLLSACLHAGSTKSSSPAVDAGSVKIQIKAAYQSQWEELPPYSVIPSGAKIDLAVESSHPVHLYVGLWTAKDALTLLSPLEQDPPIIAPKQTIVHLPGPGLWYQLDGNPGKEVLYVVASRQPLSADRVKHILSAGSLFDEREPPPTVSDKKRGPWLQTVLPVDEPAVLRFPYRHE